MLNGCLAKLPTEDVPQHALFQGLWSASSTSLGLVLVAGSQSIHPRWRCRLARWPYGQNDRRRTSVVLMANIGIESCVKYTVVSRPPLLFFFLCLILSRLAVPVLLFPSVPWRLFFSAFQRIHPASFLPFTFSQWTQPTRIRGPTAYSSVALCFFSISSSLSLSPFSSPLQSTNSLSPGYKPSPAFKLCASFGLFSPGLG